MGTRWLPVVRLTHVPHCLFILVFIRSFLCMIYDLHVTQQRGMDIKGSEQTFGPPKNEMAAT